jgi:diadenylate cyclase
MDQLTDLVEGITISPVALLDIALTALLIYGLISLIQGTRAVRLVIGAILLYGIYVLAQALNLRLLSGIMQTGAVVGLLALVVIFQPELRRGLERIGRVGSLGWVLAPSSPPGSAERVAQVVARASSSLSSAGVGGLIIIERETGLQDAAESGVILNAELSEELLASLFAPYAPLHDGAVIIQGDKIHAAAVVLPLTETSIPRERYGTRHRAAIGITEQTDALAIVISEETGAMSLVQRGRVLRGLDEERLRTALIALLRPPEGRTRAAGLAARGIARGKRIRGRRRERRVPEPAQTLTAASTGAPGADAPTRPPQVSPPRPVAPPTRSHSTAMPLADPAVSRSAGRVE